LRSHAHRRWTAHVVARSPPALPTRKRPLTRTRPRDRNHKREVTMVRQLLLAAALASLMSSAAWADITILVPSGGEGDGTKAAGTDYSQMEGSKIEIVQAPYENVFELAANAGQTKSGAFDIVLMDDPWIPFFAENGHLENLTPYFNAIGMPGPDND